MNSGYAYKVGDFVLTPEGKCDGVIVAIKDETADHAAKALVCENYFAATLLQDFGATLDYIRDNFRCKSFYLHDLMPDGDAEIDETFDDESYPNHLM